MRPLLCLVAALFITAAVATPIHVGDRFRVSGTTQDGKPFEQIYVVSEAVEGATSTEFKAMTTAGESAKVEVQPDSVMFSETNTTRKPDEAAMIFCSAEHPGTEWKTVSGKLVVMTLKQAIERTRRVARGQPTPAFTYGTCTVIRL